MSDPHSILEPRASKLCERGKSALQLSNRYYDFHYYKFRRISIGRIYELSKQRERFTMPNEEHQPGDINNFSLSLITWSATNDSK